MRVKASLYSHSEVIACLPDSIALLSISSGLSTLLSAFAFSFWPPLWRRVDCVVDIPKGGDDKLGSIGGHKAGRWARFWGAERQIGKISSSKHDGGGEEIKCRDNRSANPADT